MGEPGFARSAATAAMGQTAGNAVVDVANLGTSAYGLTRPVLQPVGGFKLFNTGSQDFVLKYTQMTKKALAVEGVTSGLGAKEAYENFSQQCAK